MLKIAFCDDELSVLNELRILLCVTNHLLRQAIGRVAYGKTLLLHMHLPTFFLFLLVAKRGVIKTAFMILTALAFTAPTVLLGNLVHHILFTLRIAIPLPMD